MKKKMTQLIFPTPNAWKAISVAPGYAGSSGDGICERKYRLKSISSSSDSVFRAKYEQRHFLYML